MTEEIDLDDMDVETDEEPEANYGDWLWRGEGDPEEEPDPEGTEVAAVESGNEAESQEDGENAESGSESDSVDTETGATRTDRVPHVPRENKDSPVGIPVEGGGAGAQSAREAADQPPDHGTDTADTREASEGEESDTGVPEASGPHGGDIDDMTMALTYKALKRLEDPQRVIADANAWADWIGIVGDVEAFVINKFQRDHRIDVDFFNGSSQGPAERLADIDETSMFYAERLVLVGLPEESWIANPLEWEFVPLSEAAAKADWTRTEQEGDEGESEDEDEDGDES